MALEELTIYNFTPDEIWMEQFVVVVWRAKEAECMACEVLGNHHRKSPQRWMELRLYDDYGWQRPTNLGCGRRA